MQEPAQKDFGLAHCVLQRDWEAEASGSCISSLVPLSLTQCCWGSCAALQGCSLCCRLRAPGWAQGLCLCPLRMARAPAAPAVWEHALGRLGFLWVAAHCRTNSQDRGRGKGTAGMSPVPREGTEAVTEPSGNTEGSQLSLREFGVFTVSRVGLQHGCTDYELSHFARGL